jgi:sugar/nucleoside kinase (ribokinase family)
LRFRHARLATPTEQELRFAFADMESGLSNLGSRFYDQTDTQQLIITMGKRGTLLFSRSERHADRLASDFLPALGGSAVDTIGAGDVFLAGVVVADLVGASVEHGAYLGGSLAALHIARLGNEAVCAPDLDRFLHERQELDR